MVASRNHEMFGTVNSRALILAEFHRSRTKKFQRQAGNCFLTGISDLAAISIRTRSAVSADMCVRVETSKTCFFGLFVGFKDLFEGAMAAYTLLPLPLKMQTTLNSKTVLL